MFNYVTTALGTDILDLNNITAAPIDFGIGKIPPERFHECPPLVRNDLERPTAVMDDLVLPEPNLDITTNPDHDKGYALPPGKTFPEKPYNEAALNADDHPDLPDSHTDLPEKPMPLDAKIPD